MRFIKTCLVVLLIVSVLGCSKKIINVQISGEVLYNLNSKQVFIKGESNLEPGTILTLFVEGEELEIDVKVLPKGFFRTTFSRDNRNKEGQLVLQLDPRKQPKELQELYGENGEYLSGTTVEYKIGESTIKSIESYAWLSAEHSYLWDQKGEN